MPKILTLLQKEDLERSVTNDKIKRAVWDCGTNKSPGLDGFTFDFIRRYWKVTDKDVVKAVEEFFVSSNLTISWINLVLALNGEDRSKDVLVPSWGLFKGILIDKSLTLSHLFYADDEVFIGKWDKSNLATIVNVLKCFFLASGLKINIHKSKLMGIGIPQEEFNSAASLIGCSTLSTPFNYLGVKVGAPSSRSSSWEEVLSKISYRLSKWKLKSLSIGGRFTLLKSVLSSMPLYHMSIYKVPMGVLNKMESLRRNFFNGVDNKERKISMIGWKKVLASKKKRGLGISSFFTLNRALLFKWIWRFISHESSLSSRFIKAMYGVRGSLDNPSNLSWHSQWSDIIKEARSLSLKDAWLTDRPLKLSFPRLYALECEKDVSVATKLIDSSLTSSFKRNPRGGSEEEQYLLLMESVAPVILSNSNDRWVWTFDSAGDFSVKSVRTLIDDSFLPSVGNEARWINVVPIKINVFPWKVCLDKLPTRFNLSLRGLDIPSILCPICHSAGESSSHLFFSCNVARLL
ncbi:RNA-directed DNA polymerase, eukaryota, reverse transcriptase zinc-binding domain protein [Tanacetum coccineum]